MAALGRSCCIAAQKSGNSTATASPPSLLHGTICSRRVRWTGLPRTPGSERLPPLNCTQRVGRPAVVLRVSSDLFHLAWPLPLAAEKDLPVIRSRASHRRRRREAMAGRIFVRKAKPVDRRHIEAARGDLLGKVVAKHPQMIVLPKGLPALLLRRQRRILIGREPAFFLWNRKDGKTLGGEYAMYFRESQMIIRDVFQHVAGDQHVYRAR